MNGDNVGRIEGENGNLGLNGEDFSNDLDVDKNPDTGGHAQEKEVMDSETDGSLEERREKRKKTYKRIVEGVVLGSMLTQAGGSAGVMANTQKEREKEDNNTPVSEQYHEDITSESTEDKQEFSFLDPSIGSGLDSEGLAKKESDERIMEYENFIDISIVNTLDITNWSMYELASTENIEPRNYLPRIVSYIYYDENGEGGVLSPSLYVIPMQKEGVGVDRELPVLKYNLTPALFRPLEIAKIYRVVTPKGDEILFGAPKESEGEIFNGKFLTLMEITTAEGETLEFMNPEISREETLSLQNDLWQTRGNFDLDFSFWEERVILSGDSETKDFEQLMSSYDPESLRIGEKYNSSEIISFLKVFEAEFLK